MPLDLFGPQPPGSPSSAIGPLATQGAASPPPATALTPASLPEMREFGDMAAARRLIFENALAAAREIEPVANQRYTLALTNPAYRGEQDYGYAAQKQAVLARRSLGRELRGTWTLTDNATGQEVGRRQARLAMVPYLTDDGSFIHRGNKYSMASQLRLRAGVYARRKHNGELESHLNVMPGKGLSHRIFLDPKTGIFKASIGQANIPLAPLLKALGVKESQLREAWGDGLAAENLRKSDPQAMLKLYDRLVRKGDHPDDVSRQAALAQAVTSMELDEEVTKRTLGQPFKNLTPEAYLAATQKLLRVSRGEEPPDDRDHLAYQTLVGPEDVFAERIRRVRAPLRQALWKATANGTLDRLPAGLLDAAVQGGLLDSGLAQPGEEVNPLEFFDQQHRITRMGQGGIPSADSVPDESRAVHPSQLAFVDFLRTPDSTAAGVDLRLARASRKGRDGKLYTQVKSLQDGGTAWKTPQDLADEALGFPGSANSSDPLVPALLKGKLRMLPRAQVQYELPDMESAFSPLGNLVPLKSMVKGQRAVMAGRMLTQALPLAEPEAPWLQSGVPGQQGRSFEEEYAGKAGAIRFTGQRAGRVESVAPGKITLRGDDGKTQEIELAEHQPSNRKTYFHHTPLVRPGEIVQPGQLLARSNFTDAQGTLALGKNLRTAYMAFKGHNFEDAIVISESAAKKMSSVHAYQHAQQWEPSHKRGKSTFISLFPSAYSKAQLDKFGEDGVVKPGTELNYGDPLILAAQEAEAPKFGVSRRNKPSFRDVSLTWEHHAPGVVTDSYVDDKGVNVIVKAAAPMEVGDKASGRMGDKGIVSCYDKDTYVFTDRGWVLFPELLPTDRVAAKSGDVWQFTVPQQIICEDYNGQLLVCEHERLNYAVTPNHRMWCRIEHYRGKQGEYKIRTAEEAHGKRLYHLAGLPQAGGTGLGFVTLPQATRNPGKPAAARFTAVDFCRFLGWWLSEGSTSFWAGRSGESEAKVTSYKVQISQSRTVNPVFCGEIEANLTSLGVGWRYSGCQYTFSNKAIWSYLSGQGLCHTKFVPPEILWNANQEELLALLDSLLKGDGAACGDSSSKLTTTSKQLADDTQTICARLGLASVQVSRPRPTRGRHSQHLVTVFWQRPEVGSGARGAYSAQPYNGKVYCVDVGGEGIILVRRGGKPFWCGNSVVPDDQMPTDSQGKPFEILLNPLGVISRVNANQIVETALGKIAAKTGKPYKVPDFDNQEDLVEWALEELRKHGESDLEDVLDAETGRKIPQVLTGNRWFMKLHHTAESKSAGRGLGAYTAEGTPAKGGPDGSKRLGMLELNALLSHGAVETIRDAKLTRGQASPEYWARVMAGFDPPVPQVPHVYEKFVASLQAAGINPVRQGPRTHLMALRDKDIDELAEGREIQNAETVDWKPGLKPKKGGLFDEALTGGHGGKRWSYIRLSEPFPSPVMEEPIRRVLGLTQKKFEAVLSGADTLNGLRGPAAIGQALAKLHLPRELERAREEIKSGKRTQRDDAVRRLKHLKAAERLGMHPREWMLSKAPVLPPVFRPVSVMGPKKLPLVADPNYLYQELLHANRGLKDLSDQLGDEDLGEERLGVYRALKAVTGLGDPTHPKNQERHVKGVLQHVFGSSPKTGLVQRKLLGSTVDLVGRSVIAPNPDLDMDQVALPEEQAWDVYKPFLVRRLVRRGLPRLAAARAAQERSPLARQALLDEMSERPVLINRAPTLHRYGIMAAWPRLTKNKVLEISPTVVAPFTADFDGDQMNYHVPASDSAVEEAIEKLLPSRNLLAARNFRALYRPSQEFNGGLFEASSRVDTKNKPRVFATVADAVRAHRRGEINIDREVEILEDEPARRT